MINPEIISALNWCEENNYKNIVLIVPYPISLSEALFIKNNQLCISIILKNPDPKITACSHYSWLGCFTNNDNSWELPGLLGPFVFLGPPVMLTKTMLEQIKSAGRRSVVCEVRPNHFLDIPLYRFKLWEFSDTHIISKISNLSSTSFTHKLLIICKTIPGTRIIWQKLFRRDLYGCNTSLKIKNKNAYIKSELDIVFFQELLKHSALNKKIIDNVDNRKKIILVNSGLAAGGAERQIVNTLKGLKARGFDDISLIGEYLYRSPDLCFYLSEVRDAKIDVRSLVHLDEISDSFLNNISSKTRDLLYMLPGSLADEILILAFEFNRQKPAIVHAWQDSTSIKVGIAAVIAGVPKIVLASRNVRPVNFGYYQEYMRPAYQALSELSQIVLTNNSEAGAADYSDWLDIQKNRFLVVRNGVDFANLQRVNGLKLTVYRDSLGIPKEVPVVGSIFRFWEEKRPLLWLKVASEITKKVPNVHFLIIGEGPMRREMEAYAEKLGIKNKVHMPGAREDIALPLSLMSTFVLTSEFEGTPNVVLEAQWLGLPVIVTDAGGTREAIQHDVTGWCCADPDAVDIAQNTIRFLSNPLRLHQIQTLAPQFVANKFSMRKMIDQTLNTYDIYDQK